MSTKYQVFALARIFFLASQTTSDNVVKVALTGIQPGDTTGSLAYVILPCIHTGVLAYVLRAWTLARSNVAVHLSRVFLLVLCAQGVVFAIFAVTTSIMLCLLETVRSLHKLTLASIIMECRRNIPYKVKVGDPHAGDN
jgi:hypothetical protein